MLNSVICISDSNKAVNSTPTKAVYGLVVDPQNDHQLASFVENQISVWDTRNFEKPVLTLTQSKPVTKVLWCPTRYGSRLLYHLYAHIKVITSFTV